ncbi:hypothetical protein I553_6033 [Mycobacterium xenopi 4042]|uniref:Uncharacterized protein n=1 Tax=Mycobacterium xenopi 4042 TaxID=1299334 RepID=X8BG13_MYCXE|nr:hypothetical protein I553_6033 [Mycobacterium xenopi 4042]
MATLERHTGPLLKVIQRKRQLGDEAVQLRRGVHGVAEWGKQAEWSAVAGASAYTHARSLVRGSGDVVMG